MGQFSSSIVQKTKELIIAAINLLNIDIRNEQSKKLQSQNGHINVNAWFSAHKVESNKLSQIEELCVSSMDVDVR